MYNVGLEEHRNSAVLTCAAKCHYSIQSQACGHEPRFVSCCACVFFSSTLGIASPLSACPVAGSIHLPFSVPLLQTVARIYKNANVKVEGSYKGVATTSLQAALLTLLLWLDGTHIRPPPLYDKRRRTQQIQ